MWAYPRGVVEAEEVDKGVHSAPLLYGLPVPPLHAHPPQHLCRYNAAIPGSNTSTQSQTRSNIKMHMLQKLELKL